MSVYVVAILRPKPAHRSAVAHALHALVCATRTEPGNIRYDLFVAGAGDDGFYLIESYVDHAAFEAHRATQHYRDYREKAADWLLEPPCVQVLSPLDVALNPPA